MSDVDGAQGRALSDAIDAHRDELVDAAEAAGKAATHCEGAACFGGGRWLCECRCAGCALFLALQVRAELEAAPAARRSQGQG